MPSPQSNGDADAAIFSGRDQIDFVALFFTEIHSVRVERFQHAVDAGAHEFIRVDVIDVVHRDLFVHFAEEVDAAVDFQKEIVLTKAVKANSEERDENAEDGNEFESACATHECPLS